MSVKKTFSSPQRILNLKIGANELVGGNETSHQAIASSNQMLGQEFNKVQSEVLDSISQL